MDLVFLSFPQSGLVMHTCHYYTPVFTQWISTVLRYHSKFLTKTYMAAANRKQTSRAIPHESDVFLGKITTV